ncbi:hypothetical protein SD71_12760 [Cohnella kolymensis]|uniref:Glycosyl transferase n=1 Tax=Cohnella kolymensis TaxID=1590652 RepID=A0ABR5A481_9BACL|nr:hypothetical protein [Cohnella kolymensis]KIL35528.1 hypothetical protein SD71_12760 [Cohnella kolymensis]
MIIGTIATKSHLPKALVMAESIKEHMPHAKVVLCLVERKMHEPLKHCPVFDEVVLAKDMGFEDFDRYVFKYDALQATCSLKPVLMEYLLTTYKHNDMFVYLDTDTRLFSPFDEIAETLETNSILLTPHSIYPLIHPVSSSVNKYQSIRWKELGILKTGLFNAGFFALKRNGNSTAFIQWWKNRLARYCYKDIKEGLFDDQRWLDLAPCYFDVYFLKHPGYNVAFWNLYERTVRKLPDGSYCVNDRPLRFFHFSQVDSYLKEIIRSMSESGAPYDVMSKDYVHTLNQHQWDKYRNKQWSYACFASGRPIKQHSRQKYARHPERYHSNPFSLANSKFL